MKFRMRELMASGFRFIVHGIGLCAAGLFLAGCRDKPATPAPGAKTAAALPAAEKKLILPGDMLRVVAKDGAPPIPQQVGEVEINELRKRDGIERIELISGTLKEEIDPRWKSVRLEGGALFLLDREKLRSLGVELVGLSEKLDPLMKSGGDVHKFLSTEIASTDGRPIPVFKLGVLYFEADKGV